MALILLAICWIAAEFYVVLLVAQAIGIGLMLLALIASWPIGTWALRSQGRAAWRRLGDAIAAGRPPGREVLNGVLVLLGGALMILPGFISDAIGALLLLPPTRALMRGPLARNLHKRLVLRAAFAGRPESPYDIDSTATDVDQPQLRP